MLGFDSTPGGTVANDNASGDADFKNMYIGNTSYAKTGNNGNPTGTLDFSAIDQGVLRYDPGNNGDQSYNAANETGAGFEMGPIWVYNSYIDFRESSNRLKYFNSANTDGFVVPSTDGTTSAGAAQPNLFLHHNGTTLLNGGTDSISISETKIGSGAIVVIPESEGPGSGDTI